jgi:predicted ribosome quality control (RQC) complex YloA/Tae2 family protein
VRQAITPGGYTLFWGRNNRSNDHVSRTLTRPDDLWFHAANMPGCHLVLRRKGEGGDVPEADVLFAAAIAAAHSRGKDAGKVEVMVAEGKWVRKPKGARPGLVTVEHYRTVVVRPQTISS